MKLELVMTSKPRCVFMSMMDFVKIVHRLYTFCYYYFIENVKIIYKLILVLYLKYYSHNSFIVIVRSTYNHM